MEAMTSTSTAKTHLLAVTSKDRLVLLIIRAVSWRGRGDSA